VGVIVALARANIFDGASVDRAKADLCNSLPGKRNILASFGLVRIHQEFVRTNVALAKK